MMPFTYLLVFLAFDLTSAQRGLKIAEVGLKMPQLKTGPTAVLASTRGCDLNIMTVMHASFNHQVGDSVFEHVSIPCNPAIVGSVAACFNKSIPSQGNHDYQLTDPEVCSVGCRMHVRQAVYYQTYYSAEWNKKVAVGHWSDIQCHRSVRD